MIERKGKRYLTRQEASEKLTAALGRGYTVRSVDRLIDRKVLSSERFDGLQWVYIPESKILKLINDRPRQIPTDPTPATTERPARRARKTAAAAR